MAWYLGFAGVFLSAATVMVICSLISESWLEFFHVEREEPHESLRGKDDLQWALVACASFVGAARPRARLHAAPRDTPEQV
jgi:hypothetical protein